MTSPLLTETVSSKVTEKCLPNYTGLTSCLDLQHTLLTISASVLSECSSTTSIIKNSTRRCMDTLFTENRAFQV